MSRTYSGYENAVFTGSFSDQFNAVPYDGCGICKQKPQYMMAGVGIPQGRLIILLFSRKGVKGFPQDFFRICCSALLLFHFQKFQGFN